MDKTYYYIVVFPNKIGLGHDLKNKYKQDKNAMMKLMKIRNDYECVMIRKHTDSDYGTFSDGPFMEWIDGNLIAYGLNNPYMSADDRKNGKKIADITPWYLKQ